jgi:hypothetical protein
MAPRNSRSPVSSAREAAAPDVEQVADAERPEWAGQIGREVDLHPGQPDGQGRLLEAPEQASQARAVERIAQRAEARPVRRLERVKGVAPSPS